MPAAAENCRVQHVSILSQEKRGSKQNCNMDPGIGGSFRDRKPNSGRPAHCFRFLGRTARQAIRRPVSQASGSGGHAADIRNPTGPAVKIAQKMKSLASSAPDPTPTNVIVLPSPSSITASTAPDRCACRSEKSRIAATPETSIRSPGPKSIT